MIIVIIVWFPSREEVRMCNTGENISRCTSVDWTMSLSLCCDRYVHLEHDIVYCTGNITECCHGGVLLSYAVLIIFLLRAVIVFSCDALKALLYHVVVCS